jgi:RNA polymerase sigma factor (TIGR02999 family)
MSDVTRLLSAIEAGDPRAGDELLPLVYEELHRLATDKLANHPPGQTLQATALVHEAYLRLVDGPAARDWNSRGHFFVAAAEAMRRIIVESVRRKRSLKRGGELRRVDVDVDRIAAPDPACDLLALDEALDKLAGAEPTAARLVELRYFSGFTVAEAAEALGVSERSASRLWAYARAWLLRELHDRP